MSKFIITLEVSLSDMESKNPELWVKRTIGSIVMRKVKNIEAKAVTPAVKK